ncbi:HdeD family acid-resistance protein [Caulobacter mirabilis]|uniref:HdeD protein n=1 Tax=Caulobacter mirabilis TaxID=69666 RepID=A0A2D2B362_9CAUL|nr:DUF308 domain-containing protein [Caulobacter mirabilis]ATQ44678.1 hypothetical protein CSW64_20955 [Caulobacter mirabilis]
MTDAELGRGGRGFTVISVLFGALLVILGFLALAAPMITGLAATITLGVLIAAAGAAGLVAVIRDKGLPGRGWAILWAVAAVALGLLLAFWPASGLATITLFLAAAFIVRGVFAVGLAYSVRKALKSWWWVALGGLVTLLLGLLILFSWPVSAAVMLGVLVAVDLIVYGVALILAGFTAGR